MKLDKFIAGLIKLQEEGHGNLEVFYCLASSGETGGLSSAFVSSGVSYEHGPFDLEEGETYIIVYAGN